MNSSIIENQNRSASIELCWKKGSRWSDIMISWDDEMSWWNSELRTNRRTFLSKRNLFDQMIWSSDLINWSVISLHHYSILHAWTIRSRVASAYLRRFVSSISSSIYWFRIESFYDHSIEMIYSSRNDFFHIY
jgi:hypothetical protein